MTIKGSIQETILEKLTSTFQPQHIALENESHMHSVPPDSETHFKLVLVSAEFDGLRQVARHQAVYGALAEELAGPVHALALHTFSPAEWQSESAVPASPECRGGSAAE